MAWPLMTIGSVLVVTVYFVVGIGYPPELETFRYRLFDLTPFISPA